ncbi:MAG TPA: cupredoxin domain-containing protein [Actinomycetota bacterium]
MYRWWAFVHLVGVFGFLAAHGVSMGVMFRLRKERDPAKVNELLQVSASSTRAFYPALAILLLGGTVAGFLGHWWAQAWIWAAIAVLILVTMMMYVVATPYYRRIRFVAQAMEGGSQAVTGQQFDEILRSPRPNWIAGIGGAGLLAILYLMMFKPAFGISTASVAPPRPGVVEVTAKNFQFDPSTLAAPSQAFTLAFHNDDRGIPHNVAIYTDSSATKALFVGATFSGTKTVDYRAPALSPGSYFFRCDVHPQMTGTLEVTAALPSPPATSPSPPPSS